MPKLCLVTLGCPKNIVEGEHIAGIVEAGGWEITTDIRKASAAIVHTCSFIADAADESVNAINALSGLRKQGKLEKLIVSGCMVQEKGQALAARFPQVTGFIGTGGLERISGLLGCHAGQHFISGAPGGLLESAHPRLLSSTLPSAYLRISEGCNHKCSFCLIPRLRGRYKSRSMKSLVEEARELADNGIRELVLIGQDTSFYGRDNYGRLALPELLRKLCRISDLKWIRVLYAHPASLTRELADTMASNEKICSYLDMPLQHISTSVLRAMKRPPNARKALLLLKKYFPAVSLRTTFITGFPGETEDDFSEMYDCIGEGWFDNLGVFEYSPHPDVASAGIKPAVTPKIARQRKKKLMLLQQKIVAAKNAALIGSKAETLIERAVGDLRLNRWMGRTRFMAPEIDGSIIVHGKTAPGRFVNTAITGATGYDLMGEITA
ncbi:MAG: ribosomal protein S12 methylthiotransferase RimO [Elusimicrobia bacterium RIFOXYA2_FULL_50_26]|nr:MAG: ribosomal protein S12 methylthiotransferase RimO [Elusimicrobia bacterium RIFOXYA2_FULL_50_26]OGS24367.1 MAG: ribosomal protein S12 methylthiotransferase RimO [Elusimicrobia bacterium RIFOXYB2_FULL_50_12]